MAVTIRIRVMHMLSVKGCGIRTTNMQVQSSRL